MARGRMPQGIRDLLVWALGYATQTYAYLFLITPKYPNSDPGVAPLAPVPAHPIRLRLTDELRRNRWTVAFRFILAMPHIIWLTLWGIVVLLLAIPAWLATLILGRLPSWMHRFFSAYVRYAGARPRVPLRRRRPVPGLRRAGRARTRSTSRSTGRSATTAGPSCSAGSSPSPPSCSRARSATVMFFAGGRRLVRLALHRPDARRGCAT